MAMASKNKDLKRADEIVAAHRKGEKLEFRAISGPARFYKIPDAHMLEDAARVYEKHGESAKAKATSDTARDALGLRRIGEAPKECLLPFIPFCASRHGIR